MRVCVRPGVPPCWRDGRGAVVNGDDSATQRGGLVTGSAGVSAAPPERRKGPKPMVIAARQIGSCQRYVNARTWFWRMGLHAASFECPRMSEWICLQIKGLSRKALILNDFSKWLDIGS